MMARRVLTVLLCVCGMLASTGARAVLTEKPAYMVGELIRVSLDCTNRTASAWVGIFEATKRPQLYGAEGRDWFALRTNPECTYSFAPRAQPGHYEIRVFEDSGYKIVEKITVVVAAGDGSVPAQPLKATPPTLDNRNFWLSLPQSYYKLGEPIVASVNCHESTIAYPGLDVVVAIYAAGAPDSTKHSGKFMRDWLYLKNHKQVGPECVLSFAGRLQAGSYEIRVNKARDPTPEERLAFTVGNESGGSEIRKPFRIRPLPEPAKNSIPNGESTRASSTAEIKPRTSVIAR